MTRGVDPRPAIKKYFSDNQGKIRDLCDRYSDLYEPVKILSHRKCDINQESGPGELAKCEFHVQWTEGEPRWDTYKKIEDHKKLREYLGNVTLQMNSNSAIAILA
jgi:hypothetical protein